jgi:hypothetical protein
MVRHGKGGEWPRGGGRKRNGPSPINSANFDLIQIFRLNV